MLSAVCRKLGYDWLCKGLDGIGFDPTGEDRSGGYGGRLLQQECHPGVGVAGSAGRCGMLLYRVSEMA